MHLTDSLDNSSVDVTNARPPTRSGWPAASTTGSRTGPNGNGSGRFLSERMVVVSNRLPIRIEKTGGTVQVLPGTGGLITALAPLMEQNKGLWVGWPGSEDFDDVPQLLKKWSGSHVYDLVPVFLSTDEVAGYYHGFANQTIWPLFHDLLGRCTFDRDHWRMYNSVNERFAVHTHGVLQDDDFVWIHDYQLMLVGHHLRRLGVDQRLGYFLHIPFPSSDLFRRLPWRREILLGLLEYDLLGFQTGRDRRNFVRCVRELITDAVVSADGRHTMVRYNGRQILVGKFPISIDFREFYDKSKSPEVAHAAEVIRDQYKGLQLILGVDRLDYTKGLSERYLALERALEKYPELAGKITLIQVVIPSRNDVPEYQKQKALVDELAGRINGRFSKEGWVPIHYMYRTLDRSSLVALYRACDIALITPLRDGMNLVAKEYCASSVDGNGVLILSEFAGAANQLGNRAILVNPYDREGMADAISHAFYMPLEQRQRRMRLMQGEIRRNDVHRWLRWILDPQHAWQ